MASMVTGFHDSRIRHPQLLELAEKTSCRFEVVLEVYERELLLLERTARVRSFIPALAMKRVLNALRRDPGIARRHPQRLAAAA